jgi:cell division cycle 2-like protein
MSEPIASTSTAYLEQGEGLLENGASASTSSSSSMKQARKGKSKWEEDDEADYHAIEQPIKKKKKMIKNFSSTLHESGSNSHSRAGSSSLGRGGGSMSPRTAGGGGHTSSALNSPLRRSSISSGASRHPLLQGCRSVYVYEKLNHIEEGSYGVVSRARDKETGDIVALKKLKMDQEKNGFPITSLREIKTLMTVGHHPNIVRVREIVVGDTLTQCVDIEIIGLVVLC